MIYKHILIFVLLTLNEVNCQAVAYHHSRHSRQSSNGYLFVDCVLPAYPENGKWQVVGGIKEPGSTILPNTLIKVSCNTGYRLKPNNAFYICDADWNPRKMPTCQATACPTVSSTLTTRVKCLNSNGKTISCDRAEHGSTATVKCAQFYELPTGQSDKIQCNEGSWSNGIFECVPVCGKPVAVEKNQDTGIFKYPWIASLYNRHADELEYICGGTLVSNTIVLTAASCVANENGDLFQFNDYQISVGKAYNVYGDLRDQSAQYVMIKEIKLHPQYKGYTKNYFSDLAVLKTKTPIRMSALVQPICFKGMNNINIPDGAKGAFALWGQKANGEIPEGLKYFEFANKEEACEKELPMEWADKYKLSDKTCVLFENEGSEKLCRGFAGAGWAFKNPTNNRYYLHGIVSIGRNNHTTMCSEPTILCTKVSSYYDFIDNQYHAP